LVSKDNTNRNKKRNEEKKEKNKNIDFRSLKINLSSSDRGRVFCHDRVGSSADPTLNGHLKYPNNLDQSLSDAAAEKIRKYRDDYVCVC
jgi:hypothetical protein